MSSTFTARAGFEKPAYGDYVNTWNTVWSTFLDAVDGVGAVGSLAVALTEHPSSTLNVAVAAGTFRKSDGTLVSYAGTSSQAMTTAAANYLYLTDLGVLTVNTTGFPAAFHVRLATVVAGASTITSIADSRIPFSSSGANLGMVYLALTGGTFVDTSAVAVVHTGTTHGVQFGGAAAELVGFWGTTPAAQPSGAAQAAVGTLATQSLTVSTGGVASTTLAAATNTTALTDSSGGTASTTLAVIVAGASYAQADMAAAQNAIASIAAELALQRSLNTVLVNGQTSLGTQVVNALADLTSLKTLVNALRSAMVAAGTAKGSA